ncbi:hypothetical protein HQ529_05120 [Candidatus Woesearchaeota archaeon]|nr:hypothetical protein [Candidatus Woesearchaeota archaeon]
MNQKNQEDINLEDISNQVELNQALKMLTPILGEADYSFEYNKDVLIYLESRILCGLTRIGKENEIFDKKYTHIIDMSQSETDLDYIFTSGKIIDASIKLNNFGKTLGRKIIERKAPEEWKREFMKYQTYIIQFYENRIDKIDGVQESMRKTPGDL